MYDCFYVRHFSLFGDWLADNPVVFNFFFFLGWLVGSVVGGLVGEWVGWSVD